MKGYRFVDYITQAYLALVALLVLLFHNHTTPHWPWVAATHFLAMAAIHALIQAYLRGWGGKAIDFLRHFYPVLAYAWLYGETGTINRMFFSDYLDPMVIRWDQALFGRQFSVLFMQDFPQRWIAEVLYASYFSYYLMIGGVGFALFLRGREQFFHYVTVTSFVFYLCYLNYILLPIIGPHVFFHEIPGYQLAPEIQALAPDGYYPTSVTSALMVRLMAWIYRVFETPGAAFPSSHVAVALVTVFFSFRYLRPIRFLHLAMALLLCLATVYGRYHYAVDVLAGVLTTALLLPLGNWLYRRIDRLPASPRPQQAAS